MSSAGQRSGLDGIDWQRWLGALGSSLRMVRQSVGLSQRDVAQLSGVSQGAVSRFEAGRRRGIPAHVVLRIAAAVARHPAAANKPSAEAVRQALQALVQPTCDDQRS